MSVPMQATDPTVIIDLVSLLAPHWEDGVSLRHMNNGALELTIILDANSTESGSKEVSIVFRSPVMHYFASVPGPDNLNVSVKMGDGKEILGNVLEFQKSDAADAWSKHFGWKLRHFHAYFFNENMRLDVIAESCERIR